MAPLHAVGLLTRHNAIDVPEGCAVGVDKLFVIFFWNYQVFTMPEVNTKTQNIVSTISAESILIAVGFNWIQMRSLFVKR
jgi:hypothetical protein